MTHELGSTGNCKPWSSINTTDTTHGTESTANSKPPLSMFTSFTIDFVCSVLVCEMLHDLVWVWFYCFAKWVSADTCPWTHFQPASSPVFNANIQKSFPHGWSDHPEVISTRMVWSSRSYFRTDGLIIQKSFPHGWSDHPEVISTRMVWSSRSYFRTDGLIIQKSFPHGWSDHPEVISTRMVWSSRSYFRTDGLIIQKSFPHGSSDRSAVISTKTLYTVT